MKVQPAAFLRTTLPLAIDMFDQYDSGDITPFGYRTTWSVSGRFQFAHPSSPISPPRHHRRTGTSTVWPSPPYSQRRHRDA
jgi:hypothetical protein